MSKTDIDVDDKKSAIIFLCISLALFLAFIGFFAWHTARMRGYELNYVKMQGTITDVEAHHSTSSDHHSGTYYYFVISYTYDGHEYSFTDRTGYKYSDYYKMGTVTAIYVDPKHPDRAERVMSSDFVSIICACFFAFFCVTYSAGMNILLSLKGSTFKKRLVFAWGAEILLGITFILLFWLGLPHSGFREVFARIKGATGLAVISQLIMFVALLDGLITCKLHSRY